MGEQAEAKVKHDADDIRRMVGDKLKTQIDSIVHIGLVPWEARLGYEKLCDCQGSILFALRVSLRHDMTIRNSDGADRMVLQGKCTACETVYIAEVQVPA